MLLDYWSNLDTFDKIIMSIIIVGPLVLLLCIYKIIQWFKKDEVIQRMTQWKKERQAHALFPLYQKIGHYRFVNFTVMCSAGIAGDGLLSRHGMNGLGTIVLFGGIGVGFILNNIIVTAKWRCEICGLSLPCKLGRSSLRPKWVDECPHCGYIWKSHQP